MMYLNKNLISFGEKIWYVYVILDLKIYVKF